MFAFSTARPSFCAWGNSTRSRSALSFSRVRSWISVTSSVRFSLQVGHLVQRPDFDLARSRHGIGAALHPGDRLVHVFDVPEPEAGDQLAGLGERPVDDRTAGTIERNTLALRGGLEAVGGAHDASIDQLLIISAHRLHRLGRGEKALFAVFRSLH